MSLRKIGRDLQRLFKVGFSFGMLASLHVAYALKEKVIGI